MEWEKFWHIYKKKTGEYPELTWNFKRRVSTAKKELIDFLGGTKIEIEKEFEITEQEVMEEIGRYLDSFWERAEKKEVLPSEVLPDVHSALMTFLYRVVSPQELISGYVSENSKIAKAKIVPPGTKIAKALREVLRWHDSCMKYIDYIIQDLSILQSSLKNANKKTKLVISVDPLDFLLASNATTGWRTCHALDGEYAAGNLSYLFDSHTLIAYAYRDYTISYGIEVPRKLWRQWIFLDVENAVALFQKQYPSEIEAFAKEIRKIVGRLLKQHHNIDGKWTFKKWEKDREERYYFNQAELAYPDPTDSYIYFKNFSPEKEDWLIKVGEYPLCPLCGGTIDIKDRLYCSRCAGYVRCNSCGRFIPEDDAFFGPDGRIYCKDCDLKLFTVCEYCETKIWREDAVLSPEGDYLCHECFDASYVRCSHCGRIIPRDDVYEGPNGEVCCLGCKQDLSAICEFCGAEVWKEEALLSPEGDYMCPECFEENCNVCNSCGKVIWADETKWFNSEPYCETCYQKKIKEENAV